MLKQEQSSVRLQWVPLGFEPSSYEAAAIDVFGEMYADAWFEQILNIPCRSRVHDPIPAHVSIWTFPGLESMAKFVRRDADVTILITKQIVKDPPTYGTDASMNIIVGEAPFIFKDSPRQVWGYAEFKNQYLWTLRWFPWLVQRFRRVMVTWEVGVLMTTPTFGVAMEESWHALSYITGKGDYANDPHWGNRARQWYKDADPGPEILVKACSIIDPDVTFLAPKVPKQIRKKYW